VVVHKEAEVSIVPIQSLQHPLCGPHARWLSATAASDVKRAPAASCPPAPQQIKRENNNPVTLKEISLVHLIEAEIRPDLASRKSSKKRIGAKYRCLSFKPTSSSGPSRIEYCRHSTNPLRYLSRSASQYSSCAGGSASGTRPGCASGRV